MRDIKFRAWYNNKMLLPFEMQSMGGCSYPNIYIWDLPDNDNLALMWSFGKDRVKLMQYTGMKDINGVEIYEFDIVRRTDNKEVGKIIFVNGCYIFENVEFEYSISLAELQHNDFGYFIEVIGNIYENPKLLT